MCDLAPDLLERVPELKERHIPVYRELADFYARESADLAVLVSPVHFHRDMTLYCLAHGSHVLCEKPLCLTAGEAEDMAAAAKAAGRFLSLGYQLDYRRDVLALKKDILAGRYGAPKRLGVYHGYRRGERYYARNDWAGKVTVHGREVLDSPFTNACAHNFQMMTFLLGDSLRAACGVTGLEAELYRGNPQVENFDIAALRFATDCGAELMYFTAHPIAPDVLGPRGVFEFEEGTITFDSEGPSFRARMKDGRQVDYTGIAPGHPLQKLLDAPCKPCGRAARPCAAWRRTGGTSARCAWCRPAPWPTCGRSCASPIPRRDSASCGWRASSSCSATAWTPGPCPGSWAGGWINGPKGGGKLAFPAGFRPLSRVEKVAKATFSESKFGQPEVARICKELILQAKSTTRPGGKAAGYE